MRRSKVRAWQAGIMGRLRRRKASRSEGEGEGAAGAEGVVANTPPTEPAEVGERRWLSISWQRGVMCSWRSV